ncbi:DUF3870 domain-containing protein [Prauserella rugosa]|uniref:Uncharacterized protein DUF3870 n=1 Tax=Prauserella rugosa TaxID=43354 RepID=A0A660CFQ4_9PSEU|nr:DUF3870 domain-containing protein [Prauserella rugosa]KID32072.1 protein of unknown function (DUF3870) [Prauserella sp. Am3]KMS83439.1 hypothetical protein ACZ91_53145 [Streptomyces regensis]TWH20687.1 uncharacterized protein DUF3870 [Prauserella rugosa]
MSSSVFVTGEAKAPSNNPITSQYGLFFIAFEIEPDTHRILDAECSATLALTNRFVRSLFAEERITDEGLLTERIAARYHGSSQRALIAAFHHAATKYRSAVGLAAG